MPDRYRGQDIEWKISFSFKYGVRSSYPKKESIFLVPRDDDPPFGRTIVLYGALDPQLRFERRYIRTKSDSSGKMGKFFEICGKFKFYCQRHDR